MSNMFVYLVRDTGGVIFVNIGVAAPPVPNKSQGLNLDTIGQVYASLDATIAHHANGLPFDAVGRLAISTNAVSYVSQGMPYTASGHLALVSSASGVAYYDQGLAFSSGGAILGNVAPPLPAPTTWGPITRNQGSVYNEADINGIDSDDPGGTFILVKDGGYASITSNQGQTFTDLPRGLNTGVNINWQDCATDNAGVWVVVGNDGRASRSIDNGVTWVALPQGLGNPVITTNLRSVATNHAGVWIAGSENGWASRSIDNGATWATIPNQHLGNPVAATVILTVAHSTGLVWFAGFGGAYASYSIDDGATWTALPQGLNSGTTTGDLYSIGGVGNVQVAVFGGGWAARNGSASSSPTSWTMLPRYLNAGTTSTEFRSVDGHNSGRFTAVGFGGYAVESLDNGVTWAAKARWLGSNPDLATAQPETFWAVNYAKSSVYALVAGDDGFASRTLSTGLTWLACPLGAAELITTVNINVLATAADDSGRAIVSGQDGWSSRTTDRIVWTPLPRALNCGATGRTITHLNWLGGSSWLAVGNANAGRSTDNGQTWNALPEGLGGPVLDFLTDIGADRFGVVCVGSVGSVRRSADYGATWAVVSFPSDTLDSVVSLDTDGAHRWIATQTNGHIKTSTDNGQTWVDDLPQGLNCGLVTESLQLTTDRTRGIWVAVGAAGWCSRSTDNGQTWVALPQFLGGVAGAFTDVQTDFAGNWLACAGAGIAYYSTDDGATWTQSTPTGLNSGSATAAFNAIGINRPQGYWHVVADAGYAATSPPI